MVQHPVSGISPGTSTPGHDQDVAAHATSTAVASAVSAGPPIEQDLAENESSYAIAWDVLGSTGTDPGLLEWAKSNAVLLRRRETAGLILCHVASAGNTVLLGTLRAAATTHGASIAEEHTVPAQVLHAIYRNNDRRGRIRADGRLEGPVSGTIYDTQVRELIRQAIDLDATDIHFRVRNQGGDNLGTVALRIDGELESVNQTWDANTLLQMLAALYARSDHKSLVKGQGQFNAERPFASFIRLAEERNAELRFQSHPERYGADVVLRVLNYDGKLGEKPTLHTLGLLPSQIECIEELAYGPRGGILAVGETGSGKTTTLSAIVQSHPDVQAARAYAMSAEDPPEGRPTGLSQFPIARSSEALEAGATGESPFIGIQRAMMRMDADIIMLGEIRDAQTAETWQDFSLTGHKTLGTLHASSPRGAIERLCSRKLGLSEGTVSGADVLAGVLFLKRVPRLCPHCRTPAARAWTTGQDKRKLEALSHLGLKRAALYVRNLEGCESCRAGKKGAQLVAEIFNPDSAQRELIAKREFARAEHSWRQTRGATPFTAEGTQGKTAFEVGLYFASRGVIGIDTLDKEIGRVLGHELVQPAEGQGSRDER